MSGREGNKERERMSEAKKHRGKKDPKTERGREREGEIKKLVRKLNRKKEEQSKKNIYPLFLHFINERIFRFPVRSERLKVLPK